MAWTRRWGASTGLALTLAATAAAAAAAERDCPGAGGTSNDSILGAAQVRPSAKRLHFVGGGSEGAPCPDAAASCRKASYVVPGDVVLTGRTLGPFACALFPGAGGRKVQGWLPLEGLEPTQAGFAGWYGYWSNGSSRITIRYADGQKIAISAELYGLVISGSMEPQAGRIAFAVAPDGKPVPMAAAGESACSLRLRVVGPYLLADSGGNCGAADFGGIYSRI